MIDVQLTDGSRVRIATDDPAAAVNAARKIEAERGIEVELPDGRITEVKTDDQETAARAAHKFFRNTPSLDSFRSRFPEYGDLTDADLADKL